MSATSAPFGLRPAYSPSGTVRPTQMTIRSTYASDILQNQPVKIVTSSTGEGTIAAAAIDDRFIGTFQGVEFTDSDGRRRYSNKWTASTTGTDIVAYVTIDPTIVYEIQSNAALAITDIGKQFDFTTIGTGNSTVGISAMMLDVASAATNASFRLLGITPGADNNWGDTYVIAQVQISEHQNVADVAAY
jgi:hypothetical protein